jgi:hypothetical protein
MAFALIDVSAANAVSSNSHPVVTRYGVFSIASLLAEPHAGTVEKAAIRLQTAESFL